MKAGKQRIKTVLKPWGKEEWLIVTGKYALKFLHLSKGKQLSLQFHKKKTESLYVLKGKARVLIGKQWKTFKKGELFHIPAKTIHRFKALESTIFIEVSTPQLKDVVRLQDDFGRK
jgi:mannose-6-phosphate isomerase